MKKFWPVQKKGTKYVAVSSHNRGNSIPLIIAMRDILKVVKNKKELKKAINEKLIKINQKEIRDTNYPISLLDILSFCEKDYRINLSEFKKMVFEEIDKKDAEKKVFKVISRKTIGDKKIQLNLMDGMNILSNEKIKSGDSVLVNLKNKKIEKIIEIEQGKKALVIKGKHAGIKGEIKEIIDRGGKSLVKIKTDKESVNVWTKNIIVI